MKKKLLTMLSALAVLMMLAVFSFCASADGGSDFDTAARINVNTTYTDNILKKDDLNYYEFTLSEQGIVYINFSHKNLFKTDEYWVATIYNSDASFISSFSFYGTDTNIDTYKIGLDRGTYYLRITGGDFRYDYSHRFDTCDYKFALRFSSSNYTEKENGNESFENAASVSVNKQYQGSINRNTDNDYFKFTISENGLIYINFQHQNLLDNQEYWIAELYDTNTQEISSWSFWGTDTSINACKIGLSSGTYYLRIIGGDFRYDYSHRFDTCDYKFQVKFFETNYSEKELNDDFKNATTIKLNKSYTGTINDSRDNDYYRITLSKKMTITLTFANKKVVDNNEYYVFKVYDNSTNELSSTPIYGAKSTTKINMTLATGTYYIRIIGGDFRYDCSHRFKTDDYKIKVTENITVPTVTNLKATQTTSSINLKWSKVSGASGYAVYQYNSKAEKYEKIASVKKNKLTVKKLKAGRSYKFKVRAYKTVSGTNYYGSYSSTLSTATKPIAPTLKAAAGTKQAKLSWNKVAGASGYAVYYSTSKNGTYKKLATTKSTKFTVKRLKSGKTYYFNVRAYKTADRNIYSSPSSAKGVRVK